MKKNKQKIVAKLKALQKQLREVEKSFYIELGKQFEKELLQNTTTERLKEIYKKLKKEFGFVEGAENEGQ